MDTIIVAVTHKEFDMPEYPGYINLLAGSALAGDHVPPRYYRDDTGDNISEKNREYCELTALYWAWKNLDADILGLCHYRRYFASAEQPGKFLQPDEAEYLLDYFDILLPAERNYIFETNRSHYANAHHEADLELAGTIISEKYPDYMDAFDRRMSLSKGHRFNMFIMKKALADEYCEWLFDILFDLEKRLDITGYIEKERRVFGFIAERLLDVWIDAKHLKTTDLDYIFIGKEHLIQKAAAMIIRKVKAAVKTK